jgi:hypothetical protein
MYPRRVARTELVCRSCCTSSRSCYSPCFCKFTYLRLPDRRSSYSSRYTARRWSSNRSDLVAQQKNMQTRHVNCRRVLQRLIQLRGSYISSEHLKKTLSFLFALFRIIYSRSGFRLEGCDATAGSAGPTGWYFFHCCSCHQRRIFAFICRMFTSVTRLWSPDHVPQPLLFMDRSSTRRRHDYSNPQENRTIIPTNIVAEWLFCYLGATIPDCEIEVNLLGMWLRSLYLWPLPVPTQGFDQSDPL